MDIDKRLIYGDSLTIGVLFEDYDTSRIQEIVFCVGSTEVGRLADKVMIGSVWAVKVPSNETIRFHGAYPIIIELTDSAFGVRKYNCGTVLFERAGSGYNSSATDSGINYLITLDPFTTLTEVTPEVYEAFVGNGPIIGENGNWYVWDLAEWDYIDTGVKADFTQEESARDSAETIRKENETARGEAEDLRDSAETTRKENETAREALSDDFAELVANPPKIEEDAGKDYWYFWDLATHAYVKSAFIAEGESSYTYIAYASDDQGTGFSLTPSSALTYMAVLATNEPIASPQASDFVGLWRVTNTSQAEIDRVEAEAIDRTFKTLNIGTGGLVTFSPTTRYFTYRLNVQSNLTLNIDLHRMIEQVGNARCRLIIDMPVVKTIILTNPILWGGTAPTFAAAGQYVFEIIDIDGSGTPLIWQVASTTKAQTTGVILYVDSAGADYSVGQINGETATRTTSTWAAPFKYLQNAINAASAGDIVFVKAGVHKPTHLRSTPTSYADGDCLNRNATFTPKNSVDVYGGFLGTESKTWQRVVDAAGLPVNKTYLDGDILGEAETDPAKTVGDTRTDASKANAAYHVIYGAGITTLTYLNGIIVRHGHSNGSNPDDRGAGWIGVTNLVALYCTATGNTATTGGGWSYGTNTNCTATGNTAATFGGGWSYGTNANCTATGNTATNGGGWSYGTNTNCTATGNTAATYGGGWRDGTNANCTATGNTAPYGGGWHSGTNTNCTATGNTATTTGGGWCDGTNTNCTATGNTAATTGGGWSYGTNTNCTATGNTANYGGGWSYGTNANCTATGNTAATTGGGWYSGTNTNCTATGNTAATNGGGWYSGTNTNCTGITNKGPQAVFGSTTTDAHINCVLIGNKNASNVVVGFDDKTATGVKHFLNNAYDTTHPTITGGAGSEIDTGTCIQNLTLEQAKITIPSFVGPPTTPEQVAELETYVANLSANLKPLTGSVLRGAGTKRIVAPVTPTTDFEGAERADPPTIGAFE